MDDDLYNAAPSELVEQLTADHQRGSLGIGAAVRTAWAAGHRAGELFGYETGLEQGNETGYEKCLDDHDL